MKEIKDREQLHHFLQTHQLEDVFNDQLKSLLTLVQFDQGEIIFSQGGTPSTLYVLVKGKIKVYTTSKEGKTLILSFKTPLEVIGDIEFVRKTEFINTVEAVSTVQMIGIQYDHLHKFGSDHSPLLQFLLHIITDKFYRKSNTLSFNLLHPVEDRLASYLLSISFDESDTLLTEQLRKVSLKDAANFIGTSYRHLNRVVLQLCKQGLIERRKGFLVIKDIDGLRTLAGHNIYE